jgi:hypothetical protein
MNALFAQIATPLFAQGQGNPPEVSYNVAFIAAVASVIAALIAGGIAILNGFLTYRGQRKLHVLQADLAQKNQQELANLQAQLKLEADLELEKTRSGLAEKTQTRLETIRAEFVAQNQKDLEFLRARLGDEGKERDARRDYEYEAQNGSTSNASHCSFNSQNWSSMPTTESIALLAPRDSVTYQVGCPGTGTT